MSDNIQAKTRVGFEAALQKGQVSQEQVAYIEDTSEIWARGKYYPCPYTKNEIDQKLIDMTPSIGENGNWFIGGIDSGHPAKGADGVSLGEIALVQEEGDSEESVISQKATTNRFAELDLKANDINTNLYKISTSEIYKTEDLVIGSNIESIQKTSFDVAGLITINVNKGDKIYVRDFILNATLPLFILLDSSNNIINFTTYQEFINYNDNNFFVVPEGCSKLIVQAYKKLPAQYTKVLHEKAKLDSIYKGKSVIYINNSNVLILKELKENTIYKLLEDVSTTFSITFNKGSELWLGDYTISLVQWARLTSLTDGTESVNERPTIRYYRSSNHVPFKYNAFSLFYNADDISKDYKFNINDGKIYLDDFFNKGLGCESKCSISLFLTRFIDTTFYVEGKIDITPTNSINSYRTNIGLQNNCNIIGLKQDSEIQLTSEGDTSNYGDLYIVGKNCRIQNVKITGSNVDISFRPAIILSNQKNNSIHCVFDYCTFVNTKLKSFDANLSDVSSYQNNILEVSNSQLYNADISLYYTKFSRITNNVFDSTYSVYDELSKTTWERAITCKYSSNCIIQNNLIKNKVTGVIFPLFGNESKSISQISGYGGNVNNTVSYNTFENITEECISFDSGIGTKQGSYSEGACDKNLFKVVRVETIKSYEMGSPQSADKYYSDVYNKAIGNFMIEDNYDIYKNCYIVRLSKDDKFGEFSRIREIDTSDSEQYIISDKNDFFKDVAEGTIFGIFMVSTGNIVEGNKLYNTNAGIALYNACFGNIIKNNFIYGNKTKKWASIYQQVNLGYSERTGCMPCAYNTISDNIIIGDNDIVNLNIATEEDISENVLWKDELYTDKLDYLGRTYCFNNIVPSITKNKRTIMVNNYTINGELIS